MIKEINSVEFIYKGEHEDDETTKADVKRYWQELQQKQSFLHEAQILVVSNFIRNKNDYTIELEQSTFSKLMYVKDTQKEEIKSLFSGAYILTNDQYVLCVMNHYYENELEFETLNLVGGMSDAKDIVDGKYSSEKCLKREVKEELGFDIDDSCWNIGLKYLKYPSEEEHALFYPIGTIYEIKTSYTRAQLESMFSCAEHDNEVKELIFFSADDYKKVYDFEHKKPLMPELLELVFKNAGQR